MKDSKVIQFLSLWVLCSVVCSATAVNAGPVRFSDVTQVIGSNPAKAVSRASLKLVVAPQIDDPKTVVNGLTPNPASDDPNTRVITEESVEIVEEGPCDCPDIPLVGGFEATKGGGFPWWALGFAAIPPLFFIPPGDNDEPSPSPSSSIPFFGGSPTPSPSDSIPPSPSPTLTPTPSITPSPSESPSGSPTPTPSGSPSFSPKPSPSGTPPQSVPEPMTILLFGTGLSGIGFAARRWFGKRREDEDESEKS